MSRLLLDQNTPRAVASLLPGHEVRHASDHGWSELTNGDLLKAGFAVLVTADKRIGYQQNLSGRKIALIVLSTNTWQHADLIARAADQDQPHKRISPRKMFLHPAKKSARNKTQTTRPTTMSPDPDQTTATTHGNYKPSAFLENIIRLLMPYFLPVTPGPAEARADILETLASYGANTRSAMLSAAQAIVFGFATLEALQEAKDPDLTPAMRLRHRSCANALTRSAEKAEQFLNFKRLYDTPATKKPPAAQTQAAQTSPAGPAEDISDADAQAAIAFAQSKIAEHRQKAAQAAPTQPARRASILPSRPDLTPEQQAEHDRLWGQAFMSALNDLGMPVQLVNATPPPSP